MLAKKANLNRCGFRCKAEVRHFCVVTEWRQMAITVYKQGHFWAEYPFLWSPHIIILFKVVHSNIYETKEPTCTEKTTHYTNLPLTINTEQPGTCCMPCTVCQRNYRFHWEHGHRPSDDKSGSAGGAPRVDCGSTVVRDAQGKASAYKINVWWLCWTAVTIVSVLMLPNDSQISNRSAYYPNSNTLTNIHPSSTA